MEKQNIKRQAMQLFRCIDRHHKQLCEKRFEKLGLHRSEHMMLMALGRHGKPVSQKTLAGDLNISPAATAVALKKLSAKGYIEKTTSLLDGRYNDVSISEQGKTLVAKSRQIMDEIDDVLICGFEKEELTAFLKTLKKMYHNLEGCGEKR